MTWKKDSVERRFAWPFRVIENGIKITGKVTGIRDENEIFHLTFNNFEKGSDYNNSKLDLYSGESWSKLKVECECYIDDFKNEIENVLPLDIDPSVLSCVVKIVNKRTRTRNIFGASVIDGKAQFAFEVDRADVFKTVTINSEFVLNGDISPIADFAYRKGSIIANGFPVDLDCDEPDYPFGGAIKCKWLQFPEEIENAMYYLDLGIESGVSPIIYLNSKHKEMQPIIDYKSSRGSKAKIRDAIFGHVAFDIWAELLFFAADNWNTDDAEIEPFVEKVIRTLQKNMGFKNGFFNESFSYSDYNNAKKKIQHFIKVAPKEVNKIKTLKMTTTDENSTS